MLPRQEGARQGPSGAEGARLVGRSLSIDCLMLCLAAGILFRSVVTFVQKMCVSADISPDLNDRNPVFSFCFS